MKAKIRSYHSLLLSLGIILVLSLYVFDKLFSPVDAKEGNIDQTQSEKELENDLIKIAKGYSDAVNKVVFSEKDDNSKFIHYQNLAEAKAEFSPYMDEDMIETFLKKYNIYEQEDGLYVLGSGYIPMTFEAGIPYEIVKENDIEYTLMQEQQSDFYGDRLLKINFYKDGDKWIMSPPED